MQQLARNKAAVTQPPSTTLYVTTTLLTGEVGRFTDALGSHVQDDNHRGLFTFTEEDLVRNEIPEALALAARCTASFPGAFEPGFVPFDEPVARQGQLPQRPAMGQFANITRSHWVCDGGLLDNQPLGVLLQRIFQRRANRPVRRLLLFVTPTTGPAGDAVAAVPADEVGRPYGLLPGLLRDVIALTSRSISSALRDISEHNDRIDARGDLRTQLTDLAARLGDTRLLTTDLLEDYLEREADRQGRPLVEVMFRQLTTWPPQQNADSRGIPGSWQPQLEVGGNGVTVCRAAVVESLRASWSAPQAHPRENTPEAAQPGEERPADPQGSRSHARGAGSPNRPTPSTRDAPPIRRVRDRTAARDPGRAGPPWCSPLRHV